MTCILFYNDHQEHELEHKEKIHLILLLALYGLLCIFDVYFKCRTNDLPGIFLVFVHKMFRH